MAGQLNRTDAVYTHFDTGLVSSTAPLSSVDKRMMDFAIKTANDPSIKTHGQIVRNFGMYPPEFWNRAQRLSSHPEWDSEMKEKISGRFPVMSRPGPMSGGANVNTNSKQFSHGLEW